MKLVHTCLSQSKRIPCASAGLFVLYLSFFLFYTSVFPAKATPANVITGCNLPVPDDDLNFVYIGAARGVTLSPLSLGDASKVITLIDVDIAASERPVFLVISSQSDVIWRIESKAEIARVVVLDNNANEAPRNGVIGVPSDRIAFGSRKYCGRISTSDSSKLIQSLFGRDADIKRHNGAEPTKSFQIGTGVDVYPGQDVRNLTELFSRQERQFLSQFPGGVATIAVEEVVATGDVIPYPILPGSAGLIQLLRNGSIRLATDADSQAWLEGFVERFQTDLLTVNQLDRRFAVNYVVRAPIFLPIAFRGRFLVESGVPAPIETEGHTRSCVFMIDGFTASRFSCYPTDASVMERIDLGRAFAARLDCRIKADLEAAAELSVVHLTNPKGKRSQKRVGKVDVVKPGRHILMLVSGQSEVTWQVDSKPDAEIAAILAPASHTVIARGLSENAVLFQAADEASYVQSRECSAFTLLLDLRESGAHVRLLKNSALAYTGKSVREILNAFHNETLTIE